jgi:peptidoglycan/LPS O-acetylase OafA/YrhL
MGSARVGQSSVACRPLRVRYAGDERKGADFAGGASGDGLGNAATFAVLFVAIVLLPRALQWPLSNRVSRWVGDISFGVFLYHLLILHVVMNAMGLRPPASQGAMDTQANWTLIGELTLIVVPTSLVVAWLSTVLVERPFRARFRRYARRFEGPGTPPVPIPHPAGPASRGAS